MIDEFRPLLEPIRLQDILNSSRSRIEQNKLIVFFGKMENKSISINFS